MNYFILMLATGFGVGLSPVAPGTLGTLLAIPIYLILYRIPFPFYVLIIVFLLFVSIWISDRAQKHSGKMDDQRIVIDEIMGFLVTMLWVDRKAFLIIIAFFLFRFFDIVKPPPIRRLEKLKGGYGIVLDDVLAGVYANVILHLIHFISRKASWL